MLSWTELSLTPPEGLQDPEPNQPWHGHPCCVASLEQFSEGIVEVPARPFGFCRVHRTPNFKSNEDRPPALPSSLCRRLHLPLPLSHRTCRCGRQLDVFGHHRAACSEAGVLGKRGFPLECAAAQVCREASARVATNVFVRDMDLATFNALDGRRLEIVADGLTLWRGAQLAVDNTMVSPLRRDGSPKPRAHGARRKTFFFPTTSLMRIRPSVSPNSAYASPSKTCCQQIPHHIMHEWSVPISSQSPREPQQ